MNDKCSRCENFVKHFGVDRNLHIFEVGCGHCVKHALKKECADFTPSSEPYFYEKFYAVCQLYKNVEYRLDDIKDCMHKIARDLANKTPPE